MPAAIRKPRRSSVAAGKNSRLEKNENSWQVQTAKARFSEVFRLARTQGPQHITKQGKDGVVMISDEEYDRLVRRSHQPKSLVQFFRESPLVGLNLKFERNKDITRDIEL